jgi:hypothetical protein
MSFLIVTVKRVQKIVIEQTKPPSLSQAHWRITKHIYLFIYLFIYSFT